MPKVHPNAYFRGRAQLDSPLLLLCNFPTKDAAYLGMTLEEKLIFMDRGNGSLPAYKKNNHQVSSSDGEGGTLAVAPLVTGGEHVLMDR